MSVVHTIFRAFNGAENKGATAIANETGIPMKTVWSWKANGEIPPWRRPAVAEAARRKKLEMPDDAWLYLASADRAAQQAAA
jgi:hypothetical protein